MGEDSLAPTPAEPPEEELAPVVLVQTAAYRNHLIPPAGAWACGACRSHTEGPDFMCWLECQRCYSGFHDDCYWRLVASPAECALWEDEGVIDLFLCLGCRS